MSEKRDDLVQVPRDELEALYKLADSLLDDWPDADYDAIDMQMRLEELGFLETVPATAEDVETWAGEWGIEEGEDCVKLSELGRRIMQRVYALRRREGESDGS